MSHESHHAMALATVLALQAAGREPSSNIHTDAYLDIVDGSGRHTNQYLLDGPAYPIQVMPWLLSIAQLDTDEQIAFLEDYYGLVDINIWWRFDDVPWGYVMTPGSVTLISNPVQFSDSSRIDVNNKHTSTCMVSIQRRNY